MQSLDLTTLNVGTILVDLQEITQNCAFLESVNLSSITLLNQFDKNASESKINALGVREVALPAILHALGIRSLTLHGKYDYNRLVSMEVAIPDVEREQYQWRYLQTNEVIRELQCLFENCRTIAFDDWSRLAGASDLWNGLLTDVIKSVGRQDLEFIFYLGDPSAKFFFEVDEALDIISDFSRHGKVTLALDEEEAIQLWKVLNGEYSDTSLEKQPFIVLKKKYHFLFNTMNINNLLIYSVSKAMLFSAKDQFVLPRKIVDHTVEISRDARKHFIEGFSMGLMLHLDMPHCIALGLIVFGSYGDLKSPPQKKDLLTYMDKWQEDLL